MVQESRSKRGREREHNDLKKMRFFFLPLFGSSEKFPDENEEYDDNEAKKTKKNG